MNAIVTTTISKPTEALRRFAALSNWILIVVADQKTPAESFSRLDCHYLTPDDQQTRYSELSELIGWNCIERRNIGYIEAVRMGAQVVASVDDDNIPYEGWGEDLLVGKTVEIDCYTPLDEVFDPLSATNHPELWHRGFPFQLVARKNELSIQKVTRSVLVQAGLWNGDPDIDATQRLAIAPSVDFNVSRPYCSTRISPFNSQNTFFYAPVMKDFMNLCGLKRMQDIWGSYLFQKRWPDSVVYTPASVYQARNPHDLSTDWHDEVMGYHSLDFIRGSFMLPSHTQDCFQAYQSAFGS